ncbi:MAG TPA: DUF302 domain-containing protein [Candidatus Acidoferrales bacterium]|nr:DUF302 domain-containing protein [Candidatus Acidoferrales bacterium]
MKASEAKEEAARREYKAQRLEFHSKRSFDEVLATLRQLVGNATIKQVNEHGSGGATREQFEKRIHALEGESGFMLFFEIDHGQWMEAYGVRRKVMRWILGNPLIAITMLKHDIRAGLFAPVELMVIENESGNGCTVIYDVPSSLMVIEENPPLLEAAQALDNKLLALVSRATGISTS